MSYNFCPTHGLTFYQLPLRNVHAGWDFRTLLERLGTKGIGCHDMEKGEFLVKKAVEESLETFQKKLFQTACLQLSVFNEHILHM